MKYLAPVICLLLLTCQYYEIVAADSSLTINTAATTNKPRSTKIAGGTAANDREFPFIVSIQKQLSDNKFEHLCTGSILSSTFILTAAHCVDTSTTIVVVYGTNDNTCTDISCTKYIKVKNQNRHPSYESKTERHDIAVYELESALPLDDSQQVNTVSIDGNSLKIVAGEDDSTRMVIVSGWGALNKDLDYPKKLQKVSVPIVDMSICNSASLNLGGFETEQICAGAGDGKDACSGDSGGPMFRQLSADAGFTQFGVVSSGYAECGATISRGLYTNTTYYLPFIKTYVPGVSINYDSSRTSAATTATTPAIYSQLLLSAVFLIICLLY